MANNPTVTRIMDSNGDDTALIPAVTGPHVMPRCQGPHHGADPSADDKPDRPAHQQADR